MRLIDADDFERVTGLYDAVEDYIKFDNKRVIHIDGQWIPQKRMKLVSLDECSIDENGIPYIKRKHVEKIIYRCSNCANVEDSMSTFCPNCGAKMD